MDNQFDVHLQEGKEYQDAGSYSNALKSFLKAADCTENKKQKFDALIRFATLRYHQSGGEVALVPFQQCFELATENRQKSAVKNNIGFILTTLNRNEEAIEELRVAFGFAMDDFQKHDAKFNEALALKELKRHDEALVSFEECLNYTNSNNDKQSIRSDIAFELYHLGKFDLAIEMYQKIFEDQNATYHQKYLSAGHMGSLFEKRNQYEEAKKAFQQAAKFAMNDTSIILFKLREIEISLKQYQYQGMLNELESLCKYASSKKIDKFHYLIKKHIGSVLDYYGRYDEAIKVLLESLDYPCSDEDKYLVFDRIGLIYIDLKMYNNAIKAFKKALTIVSDDEGKCWQLFHISFVTYLIIDQYQKIGDDDKVKISFKHCVKNLNQAKKLAQNNVQKFQIYYLHGVIINSLHQSSVEALTLFNETLKYKHDPTQMNLINFLLQIQRGKETLYTSTDLIDIIKADNFYQSVISVVTENNLQEYEIILAEFYFQVCKMVALLSVTHPMESKLAHYTSVNNAQKLLDPKGKFWLSSIAHMNDPSEGKSLLSYIKQKHWKTIFNPQLKQQAFVSCFSFNHNHLNQFRLYGNNENQVATGLSLVFERDGYFNQNKFNTFSASSTEYFTDKSSDTKINNGLGLIPVPEREHLFRCIYIDPKPLQVDAESDKLPISIVLAQREQHTFAYNDEHNSHEKYKKYINNITTRVFNGLKEIKSTYDKLIKDENLIKNFEKVEKIEEILDELCLPLRHLVKDIAFKEEQECRCIILKKLTNSKIKQIVINNKNRFYIENDSIAAAVTKIWIAPQCPSLPAVQELAARNGLKIKVEQSQLPIRD